MEEEEDDEMSPSARRPQDIAMEFECCREELQCRPSFEALGWSLVPDRYGTAGKFIPPWFKPFR